MNAKVSSFSIPITLTTNFRNGLWTCSPDGIGLIVQGSTEDEAIEKALEGLGLLLDNLVKRGIDLYDYFSRRKFNITRNARVAFAYSTPTFWFDEWDPTQDRKSHNGKAHFLVPA